MNKELFKPVNYEEAPLFETPTIVLTAEEPMTVERIVAAINKELQSIQLGTSKMTPHAVQVREGSTPFLHMLRTFENSATPETALTLVTVAKQDFGSIFGRYVESLVSQLFNGKK